MRCTRLRTAFSFLLALLAAAGVAGAVPPKLEIRGHVVLPDGTPAPNARLSFGGGGAPPVEAEADAEGRFTLSGTFEHGTKVNASSPDGLMQRDFFVSALQARTLGPLCVELRPARRVTVRVDENGRPVPGALVAVADRTRKPETTDDQGEARLRLPDGDQPVRVSVWHPSLGTAGGEIQLGAGDRSDLVVAVALRAPQPRRLRVVDHAGLPVAGVSLFASFRPVGGEWFDGSCFASLQAESDAAGEVEIAWAPKLIQYCDVEVVEDDWVLESIDQPQADGPVVARVREKRPFEGKLIVPAGCDPKGLLIAGHSFVPADRFDIVATRVSADGSYSLKLAPEHCYVLAVCDSQWASDPIFGVYARSSSKENHPLPELKLYPATSLEICATVGTQHMPLRDAYVQVSRTVKTEWTDAQGKRRNGAHAIQHWVQTDAEGYIRTGLGRGSHEISISREKWQKKQSLTVESEKPLTVTFHKPYEGRREIRGQLVQESKRTSGFTDVKIVCVAAGWRGTNVADVTTDDDGRFLFATDSPKVRFFALDKGGSVCGTGIATDVESKVSIDLRPAASYEGQLVDFQGKPIAGATLTLSIQSAPAVFPTQAKTDETGKFRFEHVFVELPLHLSLEAGGGQQTLAEHYFEPGERRAGTQMRVESASQRAEAVQSKPLSERIKVAARDARLANMHALVIIDGGDEPARQFLQHSVLDLEANPLVYEYLPVALTVADVRGRAENLALAEREKWPLPTEKQITLVAIEREKTLGSLQVAADAPAAITQVHEFFERHQPSIPAAEQLWQAALAEAKESNRRVLIQFGGPRCGPCFLFSRWIDDHHQQLERDYVMLKLHSGRHHGAIEIEERLRGKSGSIPWTAILDAKGKVLATSDSPLGNIGFPGQFESARHFRRMLEKTAQRLSADDIAALAATLGK